MSGQRIHLPEEVSEAEISQAAESGDELLFAWGHLLRGTNSDEIGETTLFTAGVERLLDLGRIVNADHVIKKPDDATDRQYDFVPERWGLTESMVRDVTQMRSGPQITMDTELNDEETTVNRGVLYADTVLAGVYNVVLPPRMMAILDPEEIVTLWYSAAAIKKGRHGDERRAMDFHQLIARLNDVAYPVLSPATSKWSVRYSHARGKQSERLETLPVVVRDRVSESFMADYVDPPKGEMEDGESLGLYGKELIFQPDFYPVQIIRLVQNMWDTGGSLII
ncbi:MAG: hypothetical protein ABIH90_02855 [Candidatus Aenigmatarchaeota archaeon]